MPIQSHEIEDLIRAAFPQATVTITDLVGDGNHYAAEVIDESFRGQNRVQQQRAVYAALKDKMAGSQATPHSMMTNFIEGHFSNTPWAMALAR